MTDDRAATEVMGYVLVIALVTILIGIVMTTGISGLESSQQGEQINNMERGFDVLSHNIESLTGHDAPSRATELRLVDGSIHYSEPTIINITVDGELLGNQSVVSEPIVYDSGHDSQIVYEAGTVIRSGSGGSVMVSEPDFVFDDTHVVLNGIRTRPQGGSATAVEEQGTVLVRAEYLGTDVYSTEVESSEEVMITIESERIDAWEAYFDEKDVGSTTTTSNELSVELDEDEFELILVRTRTRTTFIE